MERISTTSPGGGLYRLKGTTLRRASALTDRLILLGVGADALTGMSFVAAMALAAVTVGVGGGWLSSWWAVAALPLAGLRLLCSVLDGEVARITISASTRKAAERGTTTRRGAVMAELADRVGDLLVVAALAVHATALALVAAVGFLVADELATVSWAVTGSRAFPGVGGKPDRTVLVAGSTTLAPLLPQVGAAAPVAAVALAGWNLYARGRAALDTSEGRRGR